MSFDFNPDSQERIPEMAPPPERINRFNLVLLGAFAFLAVVWFAWNPVASGVKVAWARHQAQEAKTALSGNDLNGAVTHLIAAKRWAAEDVEVIRAFVAFYKVTRSDPATLAQQLRLLAGKQALTADEELLLGESLVAAGKAADARVVYEAMPAERTVKPQSMELLSHILEAEGHTAEAAEVSRRSTVGGAGTPEARLKQVLVDRGHQFFEIRRGARQQLWEIAALDDQTAVRAIAELSLDPDLTPPEARNLLAMVESHPHQTMGLRLQVVSGLMRVQPERREAILDGEIAWFQSGNEGRLADFARWLAVEKQHARLVKLLPRDLAIKSRDLYPLLADALVNEGRWQDLKEMLTRNKPPVSPALASVWMAEVESHLQPDLAESRRLLQAGIESARATGNLPALYAAATCAAKLNLSDLALTACRAAAVDDSESSVQWLQKAWVMGLMQKDAAALLDIARRLHEMRPGSSVFADRFAYLRLVLGCEVEVVALAAQKTDGSMTKDRVPPELLRALAAYRLGDVSSMQGHLAGVKHSASLPPGQRAVVAGLLTIAGMTSEAFLIAEKIPDSLLLREELVFLNKAR